MPYMKFDIPGRIIGDFVSNTKFKKDFLKYWPTTYVGGVRVMDKLHIYYAGSGMATATANTKIYGLLGTSVTELSQNDYSSVDGAWMYLKPIDTEGYVDPLTIDNIQSIIDMYDSTETHELLINFVYKEINPNTDSYVYNPTLKNSSEVFAEFTSAIEAHSYNYMYYDANDASYPILALRDLDNEFFDVTYKALSFGAGQRIFVPSGYLDEDGKVIGKSELFPTLVVSMSYKAKSDTVVTQEYVDSINTISAGNVMSISRDYSTLLDVFTVYSDNDLYYTEVITSFEGMSFSDLVGGAFGPKVKYDGLSALRVKDFRRFVGKLIDSGYKQKKVKWYKKLAAFVLMVIVVYLAIITQQYYLLQGASTAFALGMAGLVLAGGTLAMGLLSMAMTKWGDDGFAYAVGNASVALGKISEIYGYITMVVAIQNFAANGFTKSMTAEAAKQAGRDVVTGATSSIAGQVMVKMTVMEIGKLALSWIGTGFGMWQKYQANKDTEVITELQGKVETQNEALNDLPTPKKFALETYMRDSNLDLEINESMDVYVDNSTNMDKYNRKYF